LSALSRKQSRGFSRIHTSKDMNSLFTPEGSGSQQHLTNKRATVVVMFHQIFLEI
jgi:hypothetical protein